MIQIHSKSFKSVFILFFLISGCKFGDHVESPPAQSNNSDPVTGYYLSEPEDLTLCSTHGEIHCESYTPQKTPPLISGIMTTPIALILQEGSTDSALIVATDGSKRHIPVSVDLSNKSLSFIGNTPLTPLWDTDHCLTRYYIEESGNYTPDSTLSPVGPYRVRGKVQIDFQIIQTFEGDCTPTLTQLYSCFDNVTNCGGLTDDENKNLQATVQELFQPYIEAKALKPEEIPLLTSLSFKARYE